MRLHDISACSCKRGQCDNSSEVVQDAVRTGPSHPARGCTTPRHTARSYASDDDKVELAIELSRINIEERSGARLAQWCSVPTTA
jgi:hypothetical protein